MPLAGRRAEADGCGELADASSAPGEGATLAACRRSGRHDSRIISLGERWPERPEDDAAPPSAAPTARRRFQASLASAAPRLAEAWPVPSTRSARNPRPRLAYS